jgi:hypothetical protein
MQIICGPNYPIVSQRGKTIHVPKEVGTVAVWRGEATEVKYKSYADRLKAAGDGTDAHNVNPCVVGTEWGVKDASDSGFHVVTVIKKFGSETTIYSTPPTDAPKSVVARFNDLSNSTSAADNAADFEAAKIRQLEYNEKIKHAKRY